jgi:hypothetical protein
VHCLRRVDGTKHYPEDVEGEVHADGEMWSAALWRARGLVGNTTLTDRVIIAAQFGFEPDTTFEAAAVQTIETARNYGVAGQFEQAFTERGFLD